MRPDSRLETTARAPFPRLYPAQVCFVVNDVNAAVEECVATFGWGPFEQFTAPVLDASYRGWAGSKTTDVALGMAGRVQVELIHVHEGHDAVEAYQSKYGNGFQHLGMSCRDREKALTALEDIGARIDDRGEYPGIRFAFVDTPTGPGMFELLQTTGETPPPGPATDGAASNRAADVPAPRVEIDRATIVTADLDRAVAFYSKAFRWEDVAAEPRSLRIGRTESRVRRARGQAGQLLLELVEPRANGDDPYSRHLVRGDHGLVHAGGVLRGEARTHGARIEGEWLDDGESFVLCDWSGGKESLQLRNVAG